MDVPGPEVMSATPIQTGPVRLAALQPNRERVNAAAKQAAQTRFTALLHHVDEDALRPAFRRQKRQASAGVDGMPKRD
jgi:hypothetical protein